jgi:hypothetical protein
MQTATSALSLREAIFDLDAPGERTGRAPPPKQKRRLTIRQLLPMPAWQGSITPFLLWGWWHAKLTVVQGAMGLARAFFGDAAKRTVADLVGPWVLQAAGTWTFTSEGLTKLLDGTFDIDSDTWKMAIFLSTSNLGSGSTTYAALTNEHANSFGYTTGGIALTLTLGGTTTVTVDISTDPVWTAAGGDIIGRFAVIYEVAGRVLCYALLDNTPANVTATNGNTLTVAANASGVFTLST